MASLPLISLQSCVPRVLARTILNLIPFRNSHASSRTSLLRPLHATTANSEKNEFSSEPPPPLPLATTVGTTEENTVLDAGLYVVATPIGCLEDITLRALRVLRCTDKILCEDTRRTGILLHHFGIKTSMESYHLHNEHSKLTKIIKELRGGAALALVSDAGVPAINDPGAQLIAAAVAEGIKIIPIPGPSATLTALIGSGISTSSFTFCGFVEAKKNSRVRQFTSWKDLDSTLIFFVSPHALLGALEDASVVFGNDRKCCLGRELTKTYEEFWRSSLCEALEEFTERGPRGEFTLVIEGSAGAAAAPEATDDEIIEALRQAVAEGSSPSTASRQVAADMSVAKKRVYNLSLQLK